TPTDLVKDGHATSRDAISIPDAAAYRSMDLAEEPDDTPLLHVSPPTPDYKPVNLYALTQPGTAGFVRRVPPDDRYTWSAPAGPLEVTAVVLPWFIGGLLVLWFGLPFFIGCLLLSLIIALVGRARRRRRARRPSRS